MAWKFKDIRMLNEFHASLNLSQLTVMPTDRSDAWTAGSHWLPVFSPHFLYDLRTLPCTKSVSTALLLISLRILWRFCNVAQFKVTWESRNMLSVHCDDSLQKQLPSLSPQASLLIHENTQAKVEGSSLKSAYSYRVHAHWLTHKFKRVTGQDARHDGRLAFQGACKRV